MLTVVAMSLGFGVVQLDVSVVNVAVRPIGDALGGGVAALQWIVSAYTIMFAAFILSAGALGDRVGARRVFIAGFALFTAASALCGLGLSGGPAIGGALIATLGWRAIFFINVPLGAIAICLTLRYASETPRARNRSVGLLGQLTAVVALGALAAATIEGGAVGWTQPGILAGYAVAVISSLLFLRIEARRRSALLPLVLFRRPTFSTSATMGFVRNIASACSSSARKGARRLRPGWRSHR